MQCDKTHLRRGTMARQLPILSEHPLSYFGGYLEKLDYAFIPPILLPFFRFIIRF